MIADLTFSLTRVMNIYLDFPSQNPYTPTRNVWSRDDL